MTEPTKPTAPLTDVIWCGSVTILLYRDPIKWPQKDIEYMRERGILVVKSKNLANDLRVIDMQTVQGKVPADLSMIQRVALQCIGYNKEHFANTLLTAAKAELAKREQEEKKDV